MKDLHSHFLYGVDDGSKSLEETKEMLKNAYECGVTDIVFTPHYIDESKYVSEVSENEKIFNTVCVETGGYGVCWGENLCISKERLYQAGEKIPLSWEDLKYLISVNIVDSIEAANELECSKQNIDYLIKKRKIQPIKEGKKYRLFMKNDI